MTEAKKSLKRTLVGKVVSDKRAKTVTVLIERRVKHELYGKIVGKSRPASTNWVTSLRSRKAVPFLKPRTGWQPAWFKRRLWFKPLQS